MELHEEPDSNSENQPTFESPSFLAAAKKAINHGIDALKLEEKSQMRIPAAGDAEVDEGKGFQYPIRPSEPDCTFYLRTGCCKFGAHCRFNHPREERAVQTIKERDKGFPKVFDRCKFHSMPGGCRFGEACRYSHEMAESVPVELNGLGLPIRKGERACSYYMRTGTCKYYSSCKFHHPELSDVAGLHVFGFHSANFLQTTSWPSHLSLISQTLPTASIDSSSNLDILQSYMPATSSEWLNLYKDQTICEDSSLPSLSKSTNCHPSAADQNGFSKLEDSPLQLKEVIYNRKESGESHSQNGIRSEGFRLVPPWWPIHLKCHLSELEGCLLSPLGLPQRPDQPVCIYYSRFGICKYGPACKFDHPADENTEQSITMPAEEKMEEFH